MSSAPRMSRGAFIVCPEDQYYDTVVEQCGACVDICTKPATMMSCQSNCPGYLGKTHRTIPDVTSSARTSRDPVAVVHVSYRLIDKPLFWTSVVSMSVALLATIGIIVLCILRWRAAGRQRSYSRRPRHGVRNRNNNEQNSPNPDERRFSHSEPHSFAHSGSTEKIKHSTAGSDETLLSLHSTYSPESNGHLTDNRLGCFDRMTTLVSEEKGPISCHPGSNVDVNARAPYMSMELCLDKSQQVPQYIRSIDKKSLNTSYWNNKGGWTLPSTTPQHFETMLQTSVKRLSVEDLSSDIEVLSLTSQEAVLPLAQVPGSKPRPSVLDFKDKNMVVSMRSETGYRSERIIADDFTLRVP